MNWSRTEVASFLGVSRKAVESYEQGWREIPERVWKQLITTAAAQLQYPLPHHRRCWEIVGCQPERRDACFSFRQLRGRFCWLTAPNHCREAHLGANTGCLACVDCPVTRQFLRKRIRG
jgi:hypothetical protein